ncbi:MAG: GNAT family N-acetyltransferase [Phycisphaerae bacterium]
MTAQGSMRLRPFEPDDLEAVFALVARTIETSYAGVYGPTAVDHFHEHHTRDEIRRAAEEGCTVLLEQDGRLLATGTLVGDHVDRVYVAPEHQGRGLGRRVMAALEKEARRAGVRAIRLAASIPARVFYLRLGYRLVSEECHDFPDGDRLPWFRMVKDLGADEAAGRSPAAAATSDEGLEWLVEE